MPGLAGSGPWLANGLSSAREIAYIMRALKIVGIVAAALIGVALLGATAVLLLVNPNDYRADIQRLAEQKTGRRLEIGGPLQLNLFPWLAISVGEVKLGNPPSFGPEPFLTVHRASVGVKLLPLLGKRLEVSRLRIEGLSVHLVSRGQHDNPSNNWKDLVESKSPGQSAGGGGPQQTTIAGVDVSGSELIYRDEAQKKVTALTNVEAHAGALGGGASVPARIEFDYGNGSAQPVVHIAVAARVAMRADPSQVQLSDLDLALNDMHVRGSAAIADLDKMALRFDLGADDINLDRLLPPAAPGGGGEARASRAPAAQQPPTQLPIEALRSLDAQGTLRVHSITVRRLVFTGMTLPLTAKEGRVRLGPASAGFFGGRYDGDVLLDARPAQAQLSLNEHIRGVDVGALMKALFATSRLVGRGDANVIATGAGNSDTALSHSLAGKLDVNVKNGALDGVDLWYELQLAQALLKREAAPARTGAERTTFNALSATGTLEHGVLHNEDVQVATDYLKARGKGTLDLNTQAIDYYVVAQVSRVPSSPAQGVGGSGQLADLKAAEVPIRITGSLGAMKVRPDIEALARQEVRGQLQQRSDDLKQKLGEKLKDLFGH